MKKRNSCAPFTIHYFECSAKQAKQRTTWILCYRYPKGPNISHRNWSLDTNQGNNPIWKFFFLFGFCCFFRFSSLLSLSSFHYVSCMRVSMLNFQVFHFTLAAIALLVSSGLWKKKSKLSIKPYSADRFDWFETISICISYLMLSLVFVVVINGSHFQGFWCKKLIYLHNFTMILLDLIAIIRIFYFLHKMCFTLNLI